jgi:outer membrane protein assembly factor BamB
VIPQSSFLLLILLSLSATADEPKLDPMTQWPQWRGPLATGVAPHGDPPTVWAEGQNVRWRFEIPGTGQSTPIVWGDRVFLTTAIPHGDPLRAPEEHDHGAHDNMPAARRLKFVVLAVDRRDGKQLWQRTVRDEQPHEGAHVTGSWASNSAVTDGERLCAFFGSRGLHCLDLDGKVLWEKDFGDMRVRHGHGEGASPALHGDTLVVNWDHQGDSFVVALDKRTGEEKWRVARDEITSWATPLVVESGGKPQVVISATKLVRSYDLASGELLWYVGGLSRNVVASPVAADGMVFVANSYDWQALLAIRLAGAEGDLAGTDAVVWTRDRDTPYVPSPVLHGGSLCFLKHLHNVLTCLRAENGETLFGPARIPGIQGAFASPVVAGDRLFVAGRNGATAVVKMGEEFELVSLNRLDDSFTASPAIVGGELFLRGQRNLYCIAEAPASETARPAIGAHRSPSR